MSEKQKLTLMVSLLIKPFVSAGHLFKHLLWKNPLQILKLILDIVTEYEVRLGSFQIQMKIYLEKMILS